MEEARREKRAGTWGGGSDKRREGRVGIGKGRRDGVMEVKRDAGGEGQIIEEGMERKLMGRREERIGAGKRSRKEEQGRGKKKGSKMEGTKR